MDLTYLQSIYPSTKEYTLYSAPHGRFLKTDHIFRHKASLSRYKKIEIISCILSAHHRSKLDINNDKNSKKLTNSWKLNNSYQMKNWLRWK